MRDARHQRTMGNHIEGNGRTGRNVALPDENRPTWRPQDEHSQRARRPMSEDEEYDDFESRNQGYPGSFEDRYRDRYGGRGGSAYYERAYHAERYAPRGYGYSDGDRPERPNLGTGGAMHTQQKTPTGATSGHRGKGPSSYQRSDERIREIICEALTEDDRIDATEIEVSVKNGEVVLMGTVDERPMKRAAEDLVEAIPGVKDVQNQIRVSSEKRRHS